MNILTIPLAVDAESTQISIPAASPKSTNSNIQLTKEADLSNADYVKKIENFWQENVQKKQNVLNCEGKQINNADSGVFCSTGQVKDANGNIIDIPNAKINIHYIKIVKSPAQEKGAIVISTGRTETYLKYKEVAYDLWNNGYSVYIIDHRGQGMSEREKGLDNLQKGHVEDFGLFVSDFKYFADEIVQKGGHQNLYLIAHSPMHDITAYSGHFIDISVRPICKVAERLAKNNPRGFTVDGGSYHPKPFKENKYTTSEIRYDRLVKLYSDKVYEEIRLGNPTHKWFAEACKAAKYARENSSKITIPVRLYQAGNDSIVHPKGHAEFCEDLEQPEKCGGPNGMPIKIGGEKNEEGAKHELLIEKDEYRDKALKGALKFFEEKRKI